MRHPANDLARIVDIYGVHPGVIEFFIGGIKLTSVDNFHFMYEGAHTAKDFEEAIRDARVFTGCKAKVSLSSSTPLRTPL